MSDFNVTFEENDQHITLDFKEAIGTVQSVNGKIGDVVLDPGDLEYDDTETYSSGSVGDELSTLKEDLSSMQTATASDAGKALKAKTVTNGKVTEWEFGEAGGGLSEDIKQALLQIAEKVAYIDADGRDYYNDLYDALYAITAIRLNANSIMLTSIGSTQQLTATTTPAGGTVTWASSNTSIATVSNTGLVTSVGYGSCTVTASSGSVSASCAVAVSQVTLTSISAVYQQSGTVYDTDTLDSLKSDLTVTATYSDSSTATVTEYTLSGTLTAGTSTITVSYGGKTTTFTVTVTAAPTLTSISAVYTQSGTVYDTDSLDTLKTDLVVTAHWSDSSTSTVPSADYTLSGTLEVGTSTITVSYSGKTTIFTVTVSSDNRFPLTYQGNFTNSTPSSTRVTLGTEDLLLEYGQTLTVTAADGYVIYPIEEYGAGNDESLIRTAKAVGYIYVYGANASSGFVYGTSFIVCGTLSTAKIKTTPVWGITKEYAIQDSAVPSVAFSGVAFFIEKGNTNAHGNEDITIDEAKNAISWSIT